MIIPRLVGYVPIIEGVPSFAIPVFYKKGEFCVQKIDDAGRISGFVYQQRSLMSRFVVIPQQARPISRFDVGDEAYFVFDTLDRVIAGTGIQVALDFMSERHEFAYREYPFLFLEISDFCSFYLDLARGRSVPPLKLADAFVEMRQKQALKGAFFEKTRTESISVFTIFRDRSQREKLHSIGNRYYRNFALDFAEEGSVAALAKTLRLVERRNEAGLLICNIATQDKYGERLANQFSDAGLTRVDIQTPEDYERVLVAVDLFS